MAFRLPFSILALRALNLREPRAVETNPLAFANVATPEPQGRHIRLWIRACGAYHTDLHIVEGQVRAAYPIIPGHQIVGRIDARRIRGLGFYFFAQPANVHSHRARIALKIKSPHHLQKHIARQHCAALGFTNRADLSTIETRLSH